MKIGLFTLDAQIYNYGGLLQEYALYKTLQNIGYDAEIINYNISSELNTFSFKRSIKFLSINKIVRKFVKKFSLKSNFASKAINKESKELFDKFRNDFLQISCRYSNIDLNIVNDAYDAFVCGSDQIWNPSYNVPSFFLTFVQNKNKVIYAASIGVSSLSSIEKERYAVLLSDLKHISVREEEAKKILSPLTSEQIQVVLDPTMLLNRKDWMRLIKKNTSYQKSYIFCYFLGLDKEKMEAAHSYANRNQLELVVVPQDTHNLTEERKNIKAVGPIEFLNMIYHANFVLTDSFHASVFSIIYGKKFRVFSRNVGSKNMDGRIHTLLKLIGREEFLIKPNELKETYTDDDSNYDYSQITLQQNESLKWLEKALNRNVEGENA